MREFRTVLLIILKIIINDIEYYAKKLGEILGRGAVASYGGIHSWLVRRIISFAVFSEKAGTYCAEKKTVIREKLSNAREEAGITAFNIGHAFRRAVYMLFIFILSKREKTFYPPLYRGEEVQENGESAAENLQEDTLQEEFPAAETVTEELPEPVRKITAAEPADKFTVISSILLLLVPSVTLYLTAESISLDYYLGRGFLPIKAPLIYAHIMYLVSVLLALVLFSEIAAAILRKIKKKTIRRNTMFSETTKACVMTYAVSLCLMFREKAAEINPIFSYALLIIAAILFCIASVKLMLTVNRYFDE